MDVLILGCGFTGRRVAARMLQRGARVTATSRDPLHLAGLEVSAIRVGDLGSHLSEGVLVLHSIPPGGPSGLLEALTGRAARVVYLSSTAVYGAAPEVDETTTTDAGEERARLRLEAEARVAAGPWSSLILRPAAIYGPGRGVHESMQRGEHSLSERFVSRIHVDDLAAHVEAGLLSAVEGCYPVADEHPSSSREIAEFCAGLLHLPLAGGAALATREPRFASNRRVDGSAVRRLLGIGLQYPSYRTGIPASLGLKPTQ